MLHFRDRAQVSRCRGRGRGAGRKGVHALAADSCCRRSILLRCNLGKAITLPRCQFAFRFLFDLLYLHSTILLDPLYLRSTDFECPTHTHTDRHIHIRTHKCYFRAKTDCNVAYVAISEDNANLERWFAAHTHANAIPRDQSCLGVD